VYRAGAQIIIVVQPSGALSQCGQGGDNALFGRPVQDVPTLHKASFQFFAAAGAGHGNPSS